MLALTFVSVTHLCRGDYDTANAHIDELIAVADLKGSLFWKRVGGRRQAVLFAMTGKAVHATAKITSGLRRTISRANSGYMSARPSPENRSIRML
jgi:hypothetical protein